MKSFYPIFWGLSVSLGVLWIRFGRPQEQSPLFRAMIDCEPIHILAHSLIYGSLAWLAHRFVTRNFLGVLGMVLGLGGIQELSQVLGLRPFGPSELFDLGVDCAAAATMLLFLRRDLQQRR